MSKLATQTHYKLNTPQVIDVEATANQSAAFDDNTTTVRVTATVDAFIEIGSNPTATSSSHFLKSGTTEYFTASGGDKVSTIRDTSDGKLYVSEMTQ